MTAVTLITTIGGLIDYLRTLDQSAPITIDGRPPTALASYRGSYDELSIERTDARHEVTALCVRGKPFELNMAGYGTYSPGHSECAIKAFPTVADMVEALELSVGEEFEGYKGGQFVMRRSSEIWVSDYGSCDNLRITTAGTRAGAVNLVTIFEEW